MNSIDYGFCNMTPSVTGHWAKGTTIMLSSDMKRQSNLFPLR